MAYEHHIFISYAHGDDWSPWVTEKFVAKLRSYLQLEIGRCEISVDDQLRPGTYFDPNLKHRIACSKVMIPILSADYFQREWCRRELALMFEREQVLGLQGHAQNYGLIIPVRIGDGIRFPDLIMQVQHLDFERFANPDIPRDSPRALEFNDNLHDLARHLATMLHRVPDWCPSWSAFTGDGFFDHLAAKPPLPPAPPRLIV